MAAAATLVALALVLAAGVKPGAAAPAYNCDAGCPLSGEGVCGDNGVTYINDCVRECSGNTARAYSGACDQGGDSSSGGPKNPLPLGDTVLGSYIQSPAGLRVTKAQMERYSAEGFTLLGAARSDAGGQPAGVTTAKGRGKPSSPETDSGSLAAPDSLVVFDVRISWDGLVYGSEPAEITARSMLASMPAMATLPGSGPAGGPQPQPAPAASAASEAGPAVLGPALGRRGAAGGGGLVPVPPRDAEDPFWYYLPNFTRVTTLQPYPYTTIGPLPGTVPGGQNNYCTGAMIGPAVVLTAGHCGWYNKWGVKGYIRDIKFVPHMFCPKKGQPSQCYFDSDKSFPFGIHVYDSVLVRAGYVKRGSKATFVKAWRSDIALVMLRESIGTETGWLGVSYTKGTLNKQLHTAGHPNDGPVWDEYYQLSLPCTVRDTGAKDELLKFLAYPPPPRDVCHTSCGISLGGQSGQPAWSVEPDGNHTIWAVLSYGPSPDTCQGDPRLKGYDSYHQVSPADFQWIAKYRLWKPAK